MKRDLEPGDRGNRALATDLASFAVDGGVLLIGVDEGPPATPSPIPLDGLKERIDQVARSRIDPPLAVSITEIASAADPSRGYLVVVLPASPAAPHMVEHRYLGRGDTTNMRLSDSQVVRLHAARAAALTSASALLDAEIARDPFPPDARQNGHIFVVAQPTFGSAELLEGAVADMRNWMYELRKLRRITGQFAPDIEGLSDVQRRANGWALTNLGEGRVPQTRVDESITLDVEANEDGGIRLFCGRATERMRDTDSGARYVYADLHNAMCWRAVQIAERVAATTRYVGNWDLAYGATGLRGAVWYMDPSRWIADGKPYSDDIYRGVTSAAHAEIAGHRAAVVSRLIGRLNRGLTRGRFPGISEAS